MAACLASRRENIKMGFTPGMLMDNTLKYIQMYDRQNYNSVEKN